MIVADTNLLVYLLMPGEKSALADAVLKKDPIWAAPLVCRSELRNVLTLYMRLKGMGLSQALETMARAESLIGSHEFAVPSDTILELTSETGLSAYNAEFVALAARLGIPLVTWDRAMLRAVPEIAASPQTFIES